MHIKQLFDCNKLYEHMTTPNANNDDNEFKIKEKYLFFFWSNFGQSIIGYKKYSEIKQGMLVFSDVASVSDKVFGIFTPQQCYNTETPGIVKYKHTANRSNIKY